MKAILTPQNSDKRRIWDSSPLCSFANGYPGRSRSCHLPGSPKTTVPKSDPRHPLARPPSKGLRKIEAGPLCRDRMTTTQRLELDGPCITTFAGSICSSIHVQLARSPFVTNTTQLWCVWEFDRGSIVPSLCHGANDPQVLQIVDLVQSRKRVTSSRGLRCKADGILDSWPSPFARKPWFRQSPLQR